MRFRRWAFLIGLAALPWAGRAAGQDPITARVDKVFAAYDRKDSPGCALGVFRNGKIAYARGYGMADLKASVPITARTVFDIGSTSKQFTAASVLLLAERGRLSLDDDVRRHIPELPQYQKPITIRHLLHHTSGLRDYIGLLTLAGANTEGHTTPKQALDAIVRQKALNFEPGAEYLYSNSGYFLLSQIVERVSGKSMRAFTEENIFAPLGMRSTHVRDEHTSVVPNLAIGYARAPTGFRVLMSNWEQTGDGAVHTTVEDLLLWDRNFYDPSVGGKALLTELTSPGTLNDASPIPYARGLMNETFRGLKAVSHGGSWAGYRAELIRFPDERFSVATLCNVASSTPSTLARAVAAIYLEDKLAPVAPAPKPAQPAAAAANATAPPVVPTADMLRAYEGAYYSEELNTTYTLAITDGALEIRREGSQPMPLRAVSTDVFSRGGLTLRFLPDATGRISTFELSQGRVRGITFARAPGGRPFLSGAPEFAAAAGSD